MTHNEAIIFLSDVALTSTDGQGISDAIAIIEETEQGSKADAMDSLNDIYWDGDVLGNKKAFGIAIYVVSYTVDPIRPFPAIKI